MPPTSAPQSPTLSGQAHTVTHPVHRLMKGVDAFLMHPVPPRCPLGVNSQVPSSELCWGKAAGTPDLPELPLSPRAIANKKRFRAVDLH
eukprot:5466309-Amphidinium_carterae.1